MREFTSDPQAVYTGQCPQKADQVELTQLGREVTRSKMERDIHEAEAVPTSARSRRPFESRGDAPRKLADRVRQRGTLDLTQWLLRVAPAPASRPARTDAAVLAAISGSAPSTRLGRIHSIGGSLRPPRSGAGGRLHLHLDDRRPALRSRGARTLLTPHDRPVEAVDHDRGARDRLGSTRGRDTWCFSRLSSASAGAC